MQNNNLNQLIKDGYLYIENILTNEEIQEFSSVIKNHHEKIKKARNNNISVEKAFWKIISNKKITDILSKSINEKIFFMDGTSSYDRNSFGRISTLQSWHRDTDSVQRIPGEVPYCKENDYYKVFTITTYLEKKTENFISLIPNSHLSNFKNSLKNYLRIFHWKTCRIKYFRFINKIIEKMISIELEVKAGDCLIFFSTLFHKPVVKIKNDKYRSALILRYAPDGINAKNYVQYVLKTSSRKNIFNNENKLDFYEHLKKNNLLSKYFND